MTSRELPGHIQAAIQKNLARQHRSEDGRPADSAGQAWEGRDFSGTGIDGSANPLHAFDKDDGLASAAWIEASERFMSGVADEAEVVAALSNVRVFAAVVPTLAEESTHEVAAEDGVHVHGDKQADVALVTLQAADGRRAMPVFTSVPALTAWHTEARPVATWMPRACLSAVDEGSDLVVIDPGQELTFVVRRPAVWSLAQQRNWVPSYQDETLAADLHDIVSLVPGLQRLALAPGRGVATRLKSGGLVNGGGSGPELNIIATPEDGTDATGHRLMLATLQQLLSQVTSLSERADSVEISLG
ncbi:SseB family protein [Citricoccus sp. NR2]|uniref:SseB family protein n=1 Tax=Citricoccus sp. NR2 TaxID=3004095 RepID=UPI0022DE3D7F|nr:SseB family protein [Citricoccus sp. NR2]WBL18688.1 SseB family protein [Citricoccus sp. NR2]